MISSHTPSILAFASKNRLPTIFWHLRDARAGGLMAYGIEPTQSYHRAALYIDKILKGSKPQDLPV